MSTVFDMSAEIDVSAEVDVSTVTDRSTVIDMRPKFDRTQESGMNLEIRTTKPCVLKYSLEVPYSICFQSTAWFDDYEVFCLLEVAMLSHLNACSNEKITVLSECRVILNSNCMLLSIWNLPFLVLLKCSFLFPIICVRSVHEEPKQMSKLCVHGYAGDNLARHKCRSMNVFTIPDYYRVWSMEDLVLLDWNSSICCIHFGRRFTLFEGPFYRQIVIQWRRGHCSQCFCLCILF